MFVLFSNFALQCLKLCIVGLQDPVASKMFAHFQFHVWIDLDEIL